VPHLRQGVWLLAFAAACGGRASPGVDAVPTSSAGTFSSAGASGVPTAGTTGTASAGFAGVPAESGAGGVSVGGASDIGVAGQSTSAEGGESGATSWAPDAPRTLTTQATEGEWYNKGATQGLVVAPNGHVFLETAYKIYEIAGAQVSEYLTDVEAQAAIGSHGGYGFGGLGIDQHGMLYASYSGSLIRSTEPHQLEFWRADPGSVMAPALGLSVLGPDDVIALGTEGAWRVTAQAAATPLQSFLPIHDSCPYPRLNLAVSGAFVLQRTCSWKLIERGHFDGSTISDFRTWFDGTFPPSGSSGAAQFLCAAADPQGGFYFVVKQDNSTQLYYLTDDATETTGVSKIAVSPSLDQVAAMSTDNETLQLCNLAAASGGTLYLQTSKLLLRVAIQP
jgi:hypothetical protein